MLTNHSITGPLTAGVFSRSAHFQGVASSIGSLLGPHEARCSFRSSDLNNTVLPARPVCKAEDLVLMTMSLLCWRKNSSVAQETDAPSAARRKVV